MKNFFFFGGVGVINIFFLWFSLMLMNSLCWKAMNIVFLNVKLISVVDVPVNGYVIPQGSRVFANLYQVVLNSVLILLSIFAPYITYWIIFIADYAQPWGFSGPGNVQSWQGRTMRNHLKTIVELTAILIRAALTSPYRVHHIVSLLRSSHLYSLFRSSQC